MLFNIYSNFEAQGEISKLISYLNESPQSHAF